MSFSVSLLLFNLVNYAYYIILILIIAWILISWFPRYPSNRVLQGIFDLVNSVVNPIMAPLRRALPPLNIGGFALDLSPIIALFALSIARQLLLILVNSFIRPVTG